MPDPSSGQMPELFMTEQISEMRAHYPSGPYVQQLRRPNVAMTSTNNAANDVMEELAQQASLMSFGSNDNNYNSVGGGGDRPNTGSWISSGLHFSKSISDSNELHLTGPEQKEPPQGVASSMVSNLSPFAKEFVPRTTISYSSGPPAPNGGTGWRQMPVNDSREFDDFIALSYLREFIDTITIKPNKYDSGINYLTDVLNTYMDEDETVMDSVVNIIVDQVFSSASLPIALVS